MKFLARLMLCVTLALTLAPASLAVATSQDTSSFPEFSSGEHVYIVDDKTGSVLFEQGAQDKIFPASTTKLLTTLVLRDLIDDAALDEEVLTGSELDLTPEGSSVAQLKKNEHYTWRDLLYGLLLPSGNDAALAIAVHAGRLAKNDQNLSVEDSLSVFVDLMNKKAAELGCTNSHFVNPHGFHDEDHYTSAHDLFLITQAALDDTLVQDIVKTPSYTIKTSDGEPIDIFNSNWLLSKTCKAISADGTVENPGEGSAKNPYYTPECTGIKTGTTQEARNCLIFSAEDEDNSFIAIIMGAGAKPDLYSDSVDVCELVLNHYKRKQIIDPKEPYTSIDLEVKMPVFGFKDKHHIDLIAKKSQMLTLSQDAEYSATIQPNSDYISTTDDGYRQRHEFSAGTQIATLFITSEDNTIAELPLYALQASGTAASSFLFPAVALVIIIVLILILFIILGVLSKNKRSRKRQEALSYRARRRY